MKDAIKGVLYVALFAVPFIPLIVTDSLFFPFITGKNFTFRILVEIAFAAWAVLALYEPAYRPKFSWVLSGFAAVIGVMFFANVFGEFPLKSLWSNYERMDGYVTLVHVFMYLITLGSTLRSPKAWNWFFNMSLTAASILSLYAFGQLSGSYQINQGGLRVDGTLGNAAYMAVYMLFHIFIALLMAVRTKGGAFMKGGYVAIALVFGFLLIQTATRGTALGLVGGLSLAALYIALFNAGMPKVRNFALGGLLAVVLAVLGFVAVKDAVYVSEHPILGRLASISLEEGSTRFEIWGMALEGVKERPVLGWGQGNFNYVFNKYYQPELYGQEAWFDRAHNIIIDWLIAGGVLGLLVYVSVFLGSLYHTVVRSRLFGDDDFTVAEQGLLFGLLGAYFFHNSFVFDNIVSYIFFGTILAFIHSHVAKPIARFEKARISEKLVTQIAAPVATACLIVVIYFVNIPGIQASADIIDAFQARTPQDTLVEFESALARDSFANQEIREQLTQRTQQIMRAEGISEDSKAAFVARTEAELLKQIEEKPGDARVHVFVASFYRMVGRVDEAREQLVLARQFSPLKQQIIFEQAFVEMQSNNPEAATAFFKEAFELDESYDLARVYYTLGLHYTGQSETASALITTDKHLRALSRNNAAVNAALGAQNFELLLRMATYKVSAEPDVLQNYVALASVQYDAGQVSESVKTLEQAAIDFPEFKGQSEAYLKDIREGRKPGSAPVEITTGSGETVQAVTQ